MTVNNSTFLIGSRWIRRSVESYEFLSDQFSTFLLSSIVVDRCCSSIPPGCFPSLECDSFLLRHSVALNDSSLGGLSALLRPRWWVTSRGCKSRQYRILLVQPVPTDDFSHSSGQSLLWNFSRLNRHQIIRHRNYSTPMKQLTLQRNVTDSFY